MRKRARLVSRAAAARPASPSHSSSSSDDGGRLSDAGRASSDEEEEPEIQPPQQRAVVRQDTEESARLTEAEYQSLYVTRAMSGHILNASYRVVADPRATNASLILKAIAGLQAPLRVFQLSSAVTETGVHYAPTASGCALIFNALTPRFETIQVLDLNHAPVGDAGLRILGMNVGHLKLLQFLYMEDCQLGKNPGACAIGMRTLANGLNEVRGLNAVAFGKNELSLHSFVEFVGNLKFRDAQGNVLYKDTSISFEHNHTLLQSLGSLPTSPVSFDANNPRLLCFPTSPNPIVELLHQNVWMNVFLPDNAPVLRQLAQRNGAVYCWKSVEHREDPTLAFTLADRQNKRPIWAWAAKRTVDARAKAVRDASKSMAERFETCQVCLSPVVDPTTRRILPMRRYNTCCHGCCVDCAASLDSETHVRLAGTNPELCVRCQVDTRIEPSWAYGKTHATHGLSGRNVTSSCAVCAEPVAGLCEPHPLEGKVAAALDEGAPRLLRAADRELEGDLLLAHGALEETREGLKRARGDAETNIRAAFDALRLLLNQRETEVLQRAHDRLDKADAACADHQAHVLADLSALYLTQALRTTVAKNAMSPTEGGHLQFWIEREKVRLELAGALGKLPRTLPYVASSTFFSQAEQAIRDTRVEWTFEAGIDDLKEEEEQK